MGNLALGGVVCCVKDDRGGLSCCVKAPDTKNTEIVRSRPLSYQDSDATSKPAQAQQLPEPSSTASNGLPGQASASPFRAPYSPLSLQSQEPIEAQGEDLLEETYDDGSTYVGQLLDGKRHRHGTWTSPAEQYVGQWKQDHRDGQGRQTWQDGRVYEGQFQEGTFHGVGRMEWHTPQGLIFYEGAYVNDVKHGHGKYQWPDGRIYDGQWINGKREGQAIYFDSSGERREGIWKEDKLERWTDSKAS